MYRLLNNTVYDEKGKIVGKIHGEWFKAIGQTRSDSTHKDKYGLDKEIIDLLTKIGIHFVKIPILGRSGFTLRTHTFLFNTPKAISVRSFNKNRNISSVLLLDIKEFEKTDDLKSPGQMDIFNFIKADSSR